MEIVIYSETAGIQKSRKTEKQKNRNTEIQKYRNTEQK